MDNYDEKLNYSFEPADPAPAEPAQPLQQAKEEIRRSGRHTGLKIAALLTVVAIVAAAGGYALKQAIAALGEKNLAGQQTSVDAMAEQTVEPEPAAEPAAQPTDDKGAYRLERRPLPDTLPSNDTGKTLTPTQVYQMNVGAVCGIATQVTTNVWGQTTTSACTGSGFVLTEDGYIITNNHVVEGAQSVSVQLNDGTSLDATIVGTDEQTDLAVIKVSSSAELTAAEFGDSDELEPGEYAYAIGSPGGVQFANTITGGRISAINRDLTVNDRVMSLIQTDASINNGNSGGALINEYGQVVGITSAKLSGNAFGSATVEGMGFAIPINTAKDIVDEIIQNGYVSGRPSIGITGRNVSSQDGSISGVQVYSIDSRAKAASEGLKVGDVITAVDGTPTPTMDEVNSVKADKKAGDKLTLSVYRISEDKTINLSESVYGSASIAACAVAAHETGHAIQHAQGYAPLRLRSALVPVVTFANNTVQWVLLLGILLLDRFPELLWCGIALFAMTTLFSFITLPVEINASQRAVQWLDGVGIVDELSLIHI